MIQLTDERIAEIRRRTGMHPVELEDKIYTLDKPLIIESACSGWQSKYWGPRELYRVEPPGYTGPGTIRYAAIPCSIEEQVKKQVKGVDRYRGYE